MKKEFENDDIAKLFIYMEKRFNEVNDRFDGEIGSVKKQLDALQNSMDYLVGEYQKLSDEQDAEVSAHDRFTDTLDDHETRIGQLELKKQAT